MRSAQTERVSPRPRPAWEAPSDAVRLKVNKRAGRIMIPVAFLPTIRRSNCSGCLLVHLVGEEGDVQIPKHRIPETEC